MDMEEPCNMIRTDIIPSAIDTFFERENLDYDLSEHLEGCLDILKFLCSHLSKYVDTPLADRYDADPKSEYFNDCCSQILKVIANNLEDYSPFPR